MQRAEPKTHLELRQWVESNPMRYCRNAAFRTRRSQKIQARPSGGRACSPPEPCGTDDSEREPADRSCGPLHPANRLRRPARAGGPGGPADPRGRSFGAVGESAARRVRSRPKRPGGRRSVSTERQAAAPRLPQGSSAANTAVVRRQALAHSAIPALPVRCPSTWSNACRSSAAAATLVGSSGGP